MDKRGILSRQSLKKLSECLENKDINRVVTKGLFSSAKAFAISGTIKSGIHLVILNTREDASGCVNDLYNLLGEENVYILPPSEAKGSRSKVKDSSLKVQRTAAIGAAMDFKSGKYPSPYLVLVAWRESLEEEIPDETKLRNSIISITKGEKITHDFLSELLFENHFEKADFVSQPGEFAIRGGLIDIFSWGDSQPYRIDFFGNEIETIKAFDANTQRSTTEVETLNIYPNITESSGESSATPSTSIIDFLPSDSVIWVSDLPKPSDYDSPHKHIYLALSGNDPQMTASIAAAPPVEIEFHTSPQPIFNKQFEILANDIRERREKGYEVYILSESLSQIERLRSIFSTHNLILNFESFTIQEGFIDHDSKTCLYTDHQIFERYRRLRLLRTVERSERITIDDLKAFHEGDYVVHIDHGVGRYGGLVKNNINGKIQEAVKLIYRDGDVIFVSIHGLHRISKYKSADSAPPKIYKLGTGAWDKLKTQTKAKVKDIAEDLIKLYAERRVAKGFAFSPDTFLQKELESSFKYEETPDQMKAVISVKEDMEKDYPMDRLVCGDVGFGKTEVAIRAAFKAVADSKQVAVMVPTTILALQHYNTFMERLRDFPCNIDYISRLRTAKEISDIADRLKSGRLDIVIGTHRLLNKEIAFKDLGLLIIDEEQKFGVAAKERLRQLKLSVDTLTLTATPIPRTLQFSLLGARDLSIINTPPPNRLPIQTEIIDFNEETIHDIITFELERGGQIFFVHNRVEDILSVEDIIRRVCPGIRTCVAHGQMEPGVLEKKILEYMSGDYDILISTTIIENGIDIPNTNTIIINQAQNFGLSDLHQLRGRVGRSSRKAFCYLIVPPMTSISDDAQRRLKAIEAFSDLGSGFNIAMQDLDIRGMGNMLGAEQSGFIADMGFETYQRILSEAFEEIKASHGIREEKEQQSFVTDCIIDTDLQLLIPDEYIDVQAEKIRVYRELDDISDEKGLERFLAELKDRFGPIPEEVRQLTFVVRLRRAAAAKGFEKIVLKNEKMVAYFISNQMSPYYKTSQFAQIINSIQHKQGDRYMIKEQNGKLYITVQSVRTIEGAYTLIQKI